MSKYSVGFECPRCQHKHTIELIIEDIDIEPYPKEEAKK